METKNINYAFNTEYLDRILLNENAQELNKELLGLINCSKREIIDYGRKKVKEICSGRENVYKTIFKVNYPGMIFGTGNPHETKNSIISKKEESEGQLEIGFTFDFITGFPIYPGSSLKGIIRNPIEKAVKNREECKEYLSYLNEIIHDAVGMETDLDSKKAKNLLALFEERKEDRDVFYDVYITGMEDESKPMMDLDNITPHKGITKNPIPITLLRLAPGVNITTCIRAKGDCNIDGCFITPEQRIAIYNRIISDFGLGAKTSVGYGRLTRKR